MGEQLGDENYIAGFRRQVEDGGMRSGIESFRIGGKERLRPTELSFMRTRDDNQAAISGMDIGQIEKDDKIIAVDEAVLDKVARGLRSPTVAGTVKSAKCVVFMSIHP